MSWETLSQFLVKEHVGMFKAANNFDIFDLNGGDKVLECREPNLGMLTKIFRFTDYKRMTPFEIIITDTQGKQVVKIKRGISIFLSKVEVFNEKDQYIGGFAQKFFSIGGKFDVMDKSGNAVCTLKGKWTGWDFKFLQGETEFAHVTKKWAGLGKELFTSADNYVLEMSDKVKDKPDLKRLILAAVMCIDMVLKE